MRIDQVHRSLRSIVINDWKGILANPRYVRKDTTITWDGIGDLIRLEVPVMRSDVINLVNQHQYSYQVAEDGSILQLYYLFDRSGRQIISASLGFYSAIPALRRQVSDTEKDVNAEQENIEQDHELEDTDNEEAEETKEQDEELELEDQSEILEFFDDFPVSWLRIDYAPSAERGILHHACHMHVSGFPDTRFVVAGVPSPKQFVEFVIASFYPSIYSEYRLDDTGSCDEDLMRNINEECFGPQVGSVDRFISHFRIPTRPG